MLFSQSGVMISDTGTHYETCFYAHKVLTFINFLVTIQSKELYCDCDIFIHEAYTVFLFFRLSHYLLSGPSLTLKYIFFSVTYISFP